MQTFGEVVKFLEDCDMPPLIRSWGDPKIAISPHLAGKVMAITATGDDGINPFFINPDAIRNPNPDASYDCEGGGRWWPLPEGQLRKGFSFYFPKGTSLEGDLRQVWRVPNGPTEFDKAEFEMSKERDSIEQLILPEIQMVNMNGNPFNIKVAVNHSIQSSELIKDVANIAYFHSIEFVNLGHQWNKDYGFAVPWILNMLKADPKAWIVAPVEKGTLDRVIDYHMSGENNDQPVSSDRFIQRGNYCLLKADGQSRGKLGLPPEITKGYIAAINLTEGTLFLMRVPYSQSKRTKYLDNTWWTKELYGGCPIDFYNDSGEMGNFYEVEAVAPVKRVERGGNIHLNVYVQFYQLRNPSNISLLFRILYNKTKVDLSGEQAIR